MVVLSDFLSPLPWEMEGAWEQLLEQGWDVWPVAIQDPQVEATFAQAFKRSLIPTGSGDVFITGRRARREKKKNEERLVDIFDFFRSLEVAPALVTSEELDEVYRQLTEDPEEIYEHISTRT